MAVCRRGTAPLARRAGVHLPYEFNEASKFGTMKGTALPTGRSAMRNRALLHAAEWEIGISGPNLKTPLDRRRCQALSVQALPLKSSGALIQKAARAQPGGDAQCRRHHHRAL